MRETSKCAVCGSGQIDLLLGNWERCFCKDCNAERDVRTVYISSPYERTRSSVYATGNRWAIENFNATH